MKEYDTCAAPYKFYEVMKEQTNMKMKAKSGFTEKCQMKLIISLDCSIWGMTCNIYLYTITLPAYMAGMDTL